jgi:hypothetical protein
MDDSLSPQASPSIFDKLFVSLTSNVNSNNIGRLIWGLIIIGFIVYYLYNKYKTYSAQLSAYNPERLSKLEDKLKQKRLQQQIAWQQQSGIVYQEEKKERQEKIRQKSEEKYNKNNSSEDNSDDEELRQMLTKDSKPKSGFQPNWLDSNHNAGPGNGSKNVKGILRPGGNCGPSS